ncbi:hypothetical protein [Sphingobacterium faecale]|uniref:Uncharacterized protein n=1 Tax=Sphingobacterium faecale TaxID=2803775 RepID=A0ABS1R7Q0_9SPHI|nr:hypothetical protein [Sphingobacterium faecale]MBL1410017.1 hypothetical protein [Sphingobacterium faecale]
MKIKILLSFILTINTYLIFSQVFDYSQAHYKVKWKQISTQQFRLIFPSEFSSAAPKLADNLSKYIQNTSSDLERKSRFIDIIVQQNHVQQNGFVQLAPRKSEVYSTPSAIADNQEWLPNLVLHETRHIAQFDNLTGKIRAPFGEQLALALFGLNLPGWYFEGDAVLQETLFSNGGRGRLSSWQMPIRTDILSGKTYDFNKYVHGSFKDIVPSFYTIGYFMNSELFQKDPFIHDKILGEMNGKLLRPFNFQRSLKKTYGAKSSDIFKLTMANLALQWKTETNNVTPEIPKRDRYPTSYLLPQRNNNGTFALQEGPQRSTRIVQINQKSGQKHRTILPLGIQLMPYFHLQNQLITWDEYRKDARFEKQTYNIIMLYDIVSKTKKTLSKNTRYYSPVISPDLKEIACIEVDLANRTSIIRLDIASTQRIDSIPLPAGIHLQQPQFNAAGNQLIAIAVSEKGTNLMQIDLQNKSLITLLDWSNIQFEKPIFDREDIIFKANYGNKDDLFRWHKGSLTQLTDSRFGIFNPSLHCDTLWYNDYTQQGYQIASTPISQLKKQPVTLQPITTLYSNQNLTRDQTHSSDNTSSGAYTIQDYSTIKNMINFHSLTLSGNDFENFDNLKPGIFWLSNDLLNTTYLRLGYEYDNDIQKSTYSASISYQKYFPKITLSYTDKGQIGSAKTNSSSTIAFDWREHITALDINLPFSKYRGNTIYSYGFNFGTSYIKRYNISLANLQNFSNELAFPLNYQVYFNRNARRATMDIMPRWGQNFSFTFRHLPFEEQLSGTAWSLRTNFYFPGIALNHSLQARYSMQSTTGRYTYTQDIPTIEGFSYIPYHKIKNTLLFDYRLPLSYPDLSIGQFAYIKRIRARLSANYQNIHQANLIPKSNSLGIDLDFNLFKYNLPLFTASIKGTYINDSKASKTIFPTFGFSYSY